MVAWYEASHVIWGIIVALCFTSATTIFFLAKFARTRRRLRELEELIRSKEKEGLVPPVPSGRCFNPGCDYIVYADWNYCPKCGYKVTDYARTYYRITTSVEWLSERFERLPEDIKKQALSIYDGWRRNILSSIDIAEYWPLILSALSRGIIYLFDLLREVVKPVRVEKRELEEALVILVARDILSRAISEIEELVKIAAEYERARLPSRPEPSWRDML